MSSFNNLQEILHSNINNINTVQEIKKVENVSGGLGVISDVLQQNKVDSSDNFLKIKQLLDIGVKSNINNGTKDDNNSFINFSINKPISNESRKFKFW